MNKNNSNYHSQDDIYPKLSQLHDTLLPTLQNNLPAHEEVVKSFNSMILSSSGWRKVFAAEGGEESKTADITPADSIISAAAALTFLEFISEAADKGLDDFSFSSSGDSSSGDSSSGDSSSGDSLSSGKRTVVIASDSRYTGSAIAYSMTAIAASLSWNIRYLGICTIPEVLAYSNLDYDIDCFIYISASHNPIGHNGLKFGTRQGVIGGKHSEVLIENMKTYIHDPSSVKRIASALSSNDRNVFADLDAEREQFSVLSKDAYRQFIGMTASSSLCVCNQDAVYNKIREYTENSGLGLVIDFNGSARTTSIDTELLSSLGISVKTLNDKPGEIAHRIVPEGYSLEPCKQALEEAYEQDPSFLFGYVPDNDGDRGNIVYMNESEGRAEILEAQQLFSLIVMIELAFLKREEIITNSSASSTAGKFLADTSASAVKKKKMDAVVVNGPTSMRVEEIASAFGTEVFRTEVGEANTVIRAKELREKGYRVRILGEGSNGGNISHPAVVRDPLNTVMALIKLTALRDEKQIPGIFHIWCSAKGAEDAYSDYFLFEDVLSSLPAYSTTSAYEDRAILRIKSSNQAELKKAYEKLFLETWDIDKDDFFASLGISSWEEINYEGTRSIPGFGPEYRSSPEKGGLKIVFYDYNGAAAAYIWMRGSGTEPVFRVLADSRGADGNREEKLLEWHKKLIQQADAAAAASAV
ncbi:MAG: hypothetical protein K9L24_05055 [Spirochaetia bacterium]|nr:hypothetical protein [Spirochaetia bacterium]MCF7946398.1 hypothetical protein [Spirochaetia bacterium]